MDRDPRTPNAPANAPGSPQDAEKAPPACLCQSEDRRAGKALLRAAALANATRRPGEPMAEAIRRILAEEDWGRFGGAPDAAAVEAKATQLGNLPSSALAPRQPGDFPSCLAPDQEVLEEAQQKRAKALARLGEPIYAEAIAGTALASRVADAVNDAVGAILDGLSYPELAMVAGLLGNRMFRQTLGYQPEDLYTFVGRAAAERLANPAWEALEAGVRPE